MDEEGSAAPQSQADETYETIRRAIIACELMPGAQVTEAQLARRFEAGRAAVRSALIRLRQEKLVEVRPRQGYTVAPITIKQVADLFGMRMVLESAGARLAIGRLDDCLISELKNLNRASSQPAANADIRALRQPNIAFHVAIARASGNERLAEETKNVLDELERVMYLPQLPEIDEGIAASIHEHERIIEALRARDAVEAERAAYDHVVAHQQLVIGGLISMPQIRSVNLVTV